MLGAILCNLPRPEASGSFHGFPPGRVAAGTSWNKNWATDYGPLSDKARKARPNEVTEAITALQQADRLPEFFEDAQDEAQKWSLASELMQDEESLIVIMTAYYMLLRWQKQEEDDIIALLMLV